MIRSGRKYWILGVCFVFLEFYTGQYAGARSPRQALGSASTGLAERRVVDLMDLSLEELMDIKVTSVAKKAQKIFESPAAVYVITQEDIRRSGATSIAEALRMVPGFHVARIDANKWAITSRGFNNRFANKLLVLMDGRSVYTSLFSGVYWEVQDVLLENVTQIEVIRGPGATMWGANAVNGIVNIVTKKARETRGIFASAGTGTEERGFGGLQYSEKLGRTPISASIPGISTGTHSSTSLEGVRMIDGTRSAADSALNGSDQTTTC